MTTTTTIEVILSAEVSKHIAESVEAYAKSEIYARSAITSIQFVMKGADYDTACEIRREWKERYAEEKGVDVSASAIDTAWSRLLDRAGIDFPKSPRSRNPTVKTPEGCEANAAKAEEKAKAKEEARAKAEEAGEAAKAAKYAAEAEIAREEAAKHRTKAEELRTGPTAEERAALREELQEARKSVANAIKDKEAADWCLFALKNRDAIEAALKAIKAEATAKPKPKPRKEAGVGM